MAGTAQPWTPKAIRQLDSRVPTALLWLSYPGAVAAVLVAARSSGRAIDAAAGPFMMVYALTATALALYASTNPALDARSRRGWRLMCAAFVLLAGSCLAFALTELMPFPTAGDALRLLFVPVLLFGLLNLSARARTRREAQKIGLDIGIVLAGGAMVLWYLVLGAVLVGWNHTGLVTAASAAYPIGDLVLIFGAVNVLFRQPAAGSRVPLRLVVGAVGVFVIGDVYIGYQRTHAMTDEYTGWQFLCWMTAHFLLALAAAEQARQGGRPRAQLDTDLLVRPVPRLPYAAVTVGYGVLLTVAVRLPLNPYGGVVLGAVALTSLVVARQLIALRENRQLAVTDYLTGLANRALLRYELTRALGRARRSDHLIAVLLIDLNGFKQLNDTLGHEAGDAMLVAFARLLEGQVRRGDLAARLGGDEFAVLVTGNDAAGNAPIIADRIATASQRPVRIGEHDVAPSASIGWAISGPDSTVEDLLHRADVEMYRVKRAQVGAARRTERPRLPMDDERLVATPDGR